MSWNYALPLEQGDTSGGSIAKSFGVLWKSLRALSNPPMLRKTRMMAGLLSRMAICIPTQRKIAGLFKDAVLNETAQVFPRLPYKHLTCRYLLRDLPIPTCAECFFHHYDRLRTVLPIWLLRRTLLDKTTLFELEENGVRLAITMSHSMPFDTEGELSLNLQMGDKIIYIMGFSIVPGRIVQSSAKDVFLITRLQGTKGVHKELSQATKSFGDVGPIALLFAALQGIGNIFGIDTAACISGTMQISYDAQYASSFQRSYDDFFLQRGIQPNSGGFFITPLPLEEKSMDDIKKGHKIRTREKRALRREVQQACVDFFVSNGLTDTHAAESSTLAGSVTR
jgi:uncharacterized protein VirK/YbjX